MFSVLGGWRGNDMIYSYKWHWSPASSGRLGQAFCVAIYGYLWSLFCPTSIWNGLNGFVGVPGCVSSSFLYNWNTMAHARPKAAGGCAWCHLPNRIKHLLSHKNAQEEDQKHYEHMQHGIGPFSQNVPCLLVIICPPKWLCSLHPGWALACRSQNTNRAWAIWTQTCR